MATESTIRDFRRPTPRCSPAPVEPLVRIPRELPVASRPERGALCAEHVAAPFSGVPRQSPSTVRALVHWKPVHHGGQLPARVAVLHAAPRRIEAIAPRKPPSVDSPSCLLPHQLAGEPPGLLGSGSKPGSVGRGPLPRHHGDRRIRLPDIAVRVRSKNEPYSVKGRNQSALRGLGSQPFSGRQRQVHLTCHEIYTSCIYARRT